MARVATIGVYEWNRESFLAALRAAGVGAVLDVRQRRGVRGPRYAWANARRLEAALAEARLEYRHLKELAPTTAMREAQYREDDRLGEGKRSRTRLAAVYVDAYTEGVLAPADLDPVAELATRTTPALLCVERDPEACHRSLIAERLAADYGVEVVDLLPPD